MIIDENDPFIKVLEYILSSKDNDLSENTITKLEEKENDNMNGNTKIMNIFEACEYVKKHNDEYLVQRHNDRFTLHSDGKRVYTKFKKDDGEILEQTVELNNAMMCSEWVKGEKKRLYRISDYVVMGNCEHLINSETLYLGDQECQEIINQRKNMLVEEYSHLKYSRVFVKSEPIFDGNLNAITKINR